MDSIRFLLIWATILSVSCVYSSAHRSASKQSKPVTISNVTLEFVAKVFETYSKNSTERMAVQDFYRLLKTLKIGQVFNVSGHLETLGRDDSKVMTTSNKQVDLRSEETQHINEGTDKVYHHQRFHNDCISKDRLLKIHHINNDEDLSTYDFIKLCPSLIFEVQSGSCWHSPNYLAGKESDGPTLKVWLYGLASITIISLSSLLAIAIIPCLGKRVYNKVMSYLVALAVGTLSGDAFMHLIPHSFATEGHAEGDHDEEHANPLWKGVVIMSGIYLFFLIESFMKARMSSHQEENVKQDPKMNERCSTPLADEPLVNPNDMVNHNHCSPRDCNEAIRKTVKSPSADSTYMTDLSQSDTAVDSDRTPLSDEGIVIENKVDWKTSKCFNGTGCFVYDTVVKTSKPINATYSDNGCDVGHCHDTSQLNPKSQTCAQLTDFTSIGALHDSEKTASIDDHHDDHHHDKHHHHGHHHNGKKIDKHTSVATVAWMVIVGDGFHNLSDGLAVGAAFSSSITTGITTAIAVLCHELPHELGDFAILIKSGISFRQAVAYNLASAFISYVGLIIGIGLGNLDTSHVWVLALTSGLFLYISLVSMLPELKVYQEKGGFTVFLTQNAGILTGIIIMLVIALLEKH